MRLSPSQFLNVSTTSGCSIFLPPVSLPIFQSIFEMRHAARPQRTKPIGEETGGKKMEEPHSLKSNG